MSFKRLGLRSGVVAAALIAVIASMATAAVRVPLSGWFWGNPAPQGNALKAVDFVGGRGYAVGSAGTALRSDDGGLNWVGLATGTAGDLTRLQIVDPETIVVLGGGGCVLRRSNDGGKTFKKIFIVAEVNCPDRVQAMHFVDKTTGYLLLADGSVLKTTDAGDSFAKQTAVPGTAASATPGGAVAKDILFTSPDGGIAFVSPSGGGSSAAFFTTDAGISWKPLTIPAGSVDRLYRFDATTIYAIGNGTLLRSDDAGLTFVKQAFGAGQTLTSIGCADPNLCLITTAQGALNRTTDGGATATPITAASVPLAGAAFASAARAVAVGAAGQTVVSNDAGVNYTAIGGDIGGSFFNLRRGPVPTSAFAPGAKGQIALTADAGATWKVANVSTSADILDTSWSDAKTGYALDIRGGLFRTLNGGLTWQTLNAGAGAAARAVIAVPASDCVLLFGPKGIKRSTGGGEFNSVPGKVVTSASLTNADLGGSAVFAWGTTRLLSSTNKGQSWKALKLPSKKTRIRQVSFTGPRAGFLLDTAGRVWRTSNGGRTWKQSLSAGTANISGISFGSSTSGYLSVGGFGDDSTNAYLLRTDRRRQVVAPAGDLARRGRSRRHRRGGCGQGVRAREGARRVAASRQLFATATGGDAGVASPLKIKATPSKFTRKTLKSTKGKVTISGTLAGAIGGEQVTISARAVNGVDWTSRTVTAGANGGSFSATFNIKNPAVFVAQWAGDSGRNGAGTSPLTVKVTK